MNNFIINTVKYLAITLLLSGLIIYIFIVTQPAFFLGAPLDYYYCTYQYEQINKKTTFTNIIIGDSRGNASVNPKMLGEKWVNLSIPGSDFFEGYIALKKYLLNNKIDTLVMVYGINYIGEGSPYFNSRTIPFQFISYNDLTELEQVERKHKYLFHGDATEDRFDLKRNQFDRRLKLLHFPFSYRETFLDGLNSLYNSPADFPLKKGKIIQQLHDYLGYMNFGEADSNNTDGINGEYIFNPKPINQYYLSLIMELASKNKITAFLIIPPMNQASFNSYNRSKYDSTLNQYLKTVQNKYSKLSIVHDPVSLPNTLFGDPYHVNKKGTTIFTELTRSHLNR